MVLNKFAVIKEALSGKNLQPPPLKAFNLGRVARWYIFISKIPIKVYFGVPWNRKCWYVSWPFGIFYGNLVLAIMTSWYI
jgi:hypothetical protein